MKRAHFLVHATAAAGRLFGTTCRCPLDTDHHADGRPALFAQPLAGPAGRAAYTQRRAADR